MNYTALFWVAAASLASPWISIRLFKNIVPAIVLEILMGFLIGPHVFHLASNTPEISFLSQFGFSYLMFLSGIEIDFDLLMKTRGEGVVKRGVMFFLLTFCISLVVALVFYFNGQIRDPILIALLMSTTSIGIVTPVLRQQGVISSKLGQRVLIVALVADLATLMIFSIEMAVRSSGNALSVLLILVLLLLFGVVYRFLLYMKDKPILKQLKNATSELGIRGAFVLILAFLVFAQKLGVETVIGSFLAGVIISLLSEQHSLIHRKLNGIGYGFLLPIFFVSVGLNFSPKELPGAWSVWLMMILFFVTMVVNKWIPSLLFFPGASQKLKMAIGFLLASRLSLVIAVTQIATETHIISASVANAFVLFSIVTGFIFPSVFSMLSKHFPKADGEAFKKEQELVLDRKHLPEDWEMERILVRSRKYHNVKLKNLQLPRDILIVSILRDGEVIIPGGHTVIEPFDELYALGHVDALETMEQMLE